MTTRIVLTFSDLLNFLRRATTYGTNPRMLIRNAAAIRRPPSRTHLLVAALAIAMAGSLAEPASSAQYGPAWLAAKDDFRFGFFAPKTERCIHRRITLREAAYSSGAFMVRTSRPNRADMHKGDDFALGSGRYGWRVCTWWSSKFRKYMVSSTLRLAGKVVHTRKNELSAPYEYGDGEYEFGGRLQITGELGLTSPSR